jgi:WD40 repeat protein
MAMSGDGTVVATVGVTHDGLKFNSTVKLWDARTLRLLRSLDEEKYSHLEIAFSRDLLAVGVNELSVPSRERKVRLLDAKTLESRHTIDSDSSALAFSPDGKRLAIAGNKSDDRRTPVLRLWDVDKQKLIECEVDLGETPARTIATLTPLVFSPDGQLMAGAAAYGDGRVRLFDGHTGDFRILLDPQLTPAFPSGIAFAPDSKVLACRGSDNTVILWDLAAGKVRRTLKGRGGVVTTVAFSRDGRWIATGESSKKSNFEVLLWDAKNGEVKQVFPCSATINAVAFCPDSKTLIVCAGHGRDEGNNVTTIGELRLIRLE